MAVAVLVVMAVMSLVVDVYEDRRMEVAQPSLAHLAVRYELFHSLPESCK